MLRLPRGRLHVLLILTACLFQILALVYLESAPEHSLLPADWLTQFRILTVVSVALTASHLFVDDKHLVLLTIFLDWMVLVAKTASLGRSLIFDLQVLFSFFLSTCLILPPRVSLPTNLAALAGVAFFKGRFPVSGMAKQGYLLSDYVSYFCLGLFALGGLFLVRWLYTSQIRLKRSNQQLNETITKLSAVNRSFQEYASGIEEKAKVVERKRIAHDIHDMIGYTLMNIKMMMDAGRTMGPQDRDKLMEILDQTREQALGGLREARKALQSLDASETKPDWGLASIKKITSIFEASTRVHVDLQYGNMPWSLGHNVDFILYHMIQEGMTNALRHGQATEIRIIISVDNDEVFVSIADNGTGTKNMATGLGLGGMEERIRRKRGTLRAQNTPTGFEVSARIPIGENGKQR